MDVGSPRELSLAFVLAALACSGRTVSGTGAGTGSTSTTGDIGTSSGGPTPSTITFDTDTMTSADGTGTSSTGVPTLPDVPTPDVPPNCREEAADFIFLVDHLGRVHRFDPETLLVETIGELFCRDAQTTFGLAIDREGTLWALIIGFGDLGLWTIDPDTFSCVSTAFDDPLPAGFYAHAVAFVADAPDSPDETLYLAGLLSTEFDPDAPIGLARVDEQTLAVETIGPLPLVNTPGVEHCDIKGSSDARLYALCSTIPATIAELDKSDASFVQAEMLDIDIEWGDRFAVWKGEFWLFTAPPAGGWSQVHTYAFGRGSTDLVIADLGIRVVGVANSTCPPNGAAPRREPPR
jgi:hypothetical protein